MPTKELPQSGTPKSLGALASPRVDIERFRADLRGGGVEEMLGILLDTFVQDCPERFAALELAVKEGNAKTIESAAHAFKSGAGTIRATVLADGLREVEAAGRSGNLESVPELLGRIRAEYIEVLRELEATPRQ